LRRTIILLSAVMLSVSFAGCKNSGPSDKDWSKVALQPYEGVVDGIKFAVQVPAGMKITAQEDIRTEWEAADGDPFKSPHLSVSRTFTTPATPDEALEFVMPDDKDVIVKKAAVDGGFVVVWHTQRKGLARAQVYRIKGEQALDCRASLANDNGIPNFDATLAWLEQICVSLQLK
jgi:hypothetical protein